MEKKKFILTVSCPDQIGIVADTTSCLASHGCFIYSSDQFSDLDTKQFFMRLLFDCENIEEISTCLNAMSDKYNWQMELHDASYKPRVVILASKQGHCLNDILNKVHEGRLNIDVKAIISNHNKLHEMANWYQVPYYHLPVAPETKAEQESQILKIIEECDADLVVLAKYMQILSRNMCKTLAGKAINIHHSFLPSFKGGRPYHQAHERGVKLIGATGHFVTADLDEGPIICQEVIRVNHRYTVQDFIRYGMDIEALVLSRCIKYFADRKIFLNGHRTVVLK